MKRLLFCLLVLRVQAQPVEHEAVFDDSRVHSIHITMAGADYETIGRKPFDWVEASVEIDGEKVSRVGVREKGNSSTGIRSDKKPWKIDFCEYVKGQRFHGLRMLVLNNGFKDPTLLREKLAYDLFRAAGCPASRAAHAAVWITAKGKFEKRYFGLYTMVEHVDEAWLDERFGGHAGNLYKPEGMGDLFASEDVRIKDEKAVELKTNEAANDRSRLVEFVRAVRDPKGNVGEWLDVESFLRWLAVNTALVNLDSYAGTGHNYCLYDDPKTGRFVFIPWDLNEAFGNFQQGPSDDHLAWDIRKPWTGKKALIQRVLAVPEWRDAYLELLKKLCEGEFAPKRMAARIDALQKLTADAAAKDTMKQFATAVLVKAMSEDVEGGQRGPQVMKIFGLKCFVERRVSSILAQLAGTEKGKELQGGPGAPGGGPPGGPGGPPDMRMRDWDTNRDGKIEKGEWRGSEEEFERADRNSDGSVDEGELRR